MLLLFLGLICWSEIHFRKLNRKQIRNGALVILSGLVVIIGYFLLPSFTSVYWNWLHEKIGSYLPEIILKAGVVLLIVLAVFRYKIRKRKAT